MANNLLAFGALAGIGLAFSLVIMLALYVYFALAMSTIARKLKYDKPWIAWIPIVNLILYPQLADKEWPWVFMFLVPIANFVFMIMWLWKIYEKRNIPGTLSLIYIGQVIPFLNIFAGIANIIIIGIAAWRD